MLILAADTFQSSSNALPVRRTVRRTVYVSIKCNSYAILHNQQYSEIVTSI